MEIFWFYKEFKYFWEADVGWYVSLKVKNYLRLLVDVSAPLRLALDTLSEREHKEREALNKISVITDHLFPASRRSKASSFESEGILWTKWRVVTCLCDDVGVKSPAAYHHVLDHAGFVMHHVFCYPDVEGPWSGADVRLMTLVVTLFCSSYTYFFVLHRLLLARLQILILHGDKPFSSSELSLASNYCRTCAQGDFFLKMAYTWCWT